jgi:hypothetical protein
MEEEDIKAILQHPTRIEIASDGGYNSTTGISSYGWVIAFNRTLIAMGRGPAAAHPELAESFRAEGYGLASAAKFISIMLGYFKVDKHEHAWKMYIDNKAMIQRMESYHGKIRHSKSNLRSDADITNKAHNMLADLPVAFIHVKSHQDLTTDHERLPYNAQLNVLADAQATLQQNQMSEPLTTIKNTCMLVIQD